MHRNTITDRDLWIALIVFMLGSACVVHCVLKVVMRSYWYY